MNCYSLRCISQPALNSSEAAVWHFCTLTSFYLCSHYFFRNIFIQAVCLCIFCLSNKHKLQKYKCLWICKMWHVSCCLWPQVSFFSISWLFLMFFTFSLWEIILCTSVGWISYYILKFLCTLLALSESCCRQVKCCFKLHHWNNLHSIRY